MDAAYHSYWVDPAKIGRHIARAARRPSLTRFVETKYRRVIRNPLCRLVDHLDEEQRTGFQASPPDRWRLLYAPSRRRQDQRGPVGRQYTSLNFH